MKNPLVTILLTTYNRAHLIGETLDSILAQTYTNWECIIIDDNSTDGTEGYLLENYLSKDDRFSYYKKDLSKYKKGLGGSRNQSLDIAKERSAEYIQLFDDDDIMHPQKIELQMTPFIEDDKLDMTLCKYRTFDEKLKYDFDLKRSEDYSTNIICNDLFWDFYANKINLNSLGPIWKLKSLYGFRFNENLQTGEEREFYLRVFFHLNIIYCPIDKILFWYRKHDFSITKCNNSEYSLRYIDQNIRKMIFCSLKKVPFKKRVRAFLNYIKNFLRI